MNRDPLPLLAALLSYAFRWVEWAFGRFCDINIPASDNYFLEIQRLGRDGRRELLKKCWADCKPRFIAPVALAALAVLVAGASGCVSMGGRCREFTVWPVVSITGNECYPSDLTLIRWRRK